MILSKTNVKELKEFQPELVIIENKISGYFYLSASLEKKSKNRGKKVNCYLWNDKVDSINYIFDDFDVNITIDEFLYPVTVYSEKILSWKDKIPEEYWHVNPNKSLCLGERADIVEMQAKYPFANFINILLMQYFYYMCYIKKRGIEPWQAYRHGLFRVLETAYNSNKIGESLKLLKYCNKKEIEALLNKTHKRKIEKNNTCPFCKNKILAGSCNKHKKQIKGYNNIIKSC